MRDRTFGRHTLTRVAALALSLAAMARPAAAQQQPAQCAGISPQTFSLAAPTDGSIAIPVDFKTVYVAIPRGALASLPPALQQRVLFIDDAGVTTEGGVLRPSTRDDLPNNLPSIASAGTGALDGLMFSYTWVPALRAATRYTALLARLDENNCIFARLGTFTTAVSS